MLTQTLDQQYLAHTYNRFPLEIVGGKGSLLRGADGREYIDLGSGIGVNIFGMDDDEWRDAVTAQLGRFQHVSNLYYSEPAAKLAQMLCERTGLKRVFFSNSGAESNECAIKAARKWAAEHKGPDYCSIITLRGSFHGRTLATLAATGQDWCQAGFEPLPVGFAYADFNDLESVKAAISEKTVAIMLEAVQGEGGVTPATPEFMAGIRALCDEKNLIMICDEVQCGMGRTGTWWGWQNFDVQPDLFTCAKSLADGVPMGALVSNAKFADVFQPGSHASTFGGNPLSCAAALATIKIIEDEGLLAAAAAKGEMLRAALQAFAEKYDQVLDVRGLGLMLGMVVDGDPKAVVDAFRDFNVLALTAHGNVVRFLPTLSMSEAHIEEAVEMMGDALDGLWGAEA